MRVHPKDFQIERVIKLFSQRASTNEFVEEPSDEEEEGKEKAEIRTVSNQEILEQFTLKSQLAETFMK